jgi:hypothetical protein
MQKATMADTGDLVDLGFSQDDSPLGDTIVLRNCLASFASEEAPRDEIGACIKNVRWRTCAYGARSNPVFPFYASIKGANKLLLASDVLNSLKAIRFKSDYIKDLECENIDFPGYHSGAANNDEIHNDDTKQNVFAIEEDSIDAPESFENHKYLKGLVDGGKLWYVLLHPVKHKHVDDTGSYGYFCEMVCLFAVGKSLVDDCLIGVVTHQVCHNLCD